MVSQKNSLQKAFYCNINDDLTPLELQKLKNAFYETINS